MPTRASRYRDEVERLYKVLDSHLEGREYLVGDKFSYADITAQPWYVVCPLHAANDCSLLSRERKAES